MADIARPVEVEILLWRLDRPVEETAQLRTLLSVEERGRADRFIRTIDRDRWTVARAGLRSGLAPAMGVAPEAIVFGREVNARPTVVNGGALSFNLSHSADVAALALSFDARVGVDVEEIRPIEQDEVDWALSPPERVELSRVETPLRLETFFRFWTLKEAFMKGTGLGAALPLHDFDIGLAAPGLLRLRDAPSEPGRWKFAENSPRPGIRGAVSALTEERPLSAVWRWVEPR
ncbi:MAG: 4'-phosphopantetheinyl transferase superfamily protein [Hyphomonadaceae bacterium]